MRALARTEPAPQNLLDRTLIGSLCAAVAMSLILVLMDVLALCRACSSRSVLWAVAGLLAYTVLLTLAWHFRLRAFLSLPLGIALGVHISLISVMIKHENACWFCVIVGASSLVGLLSTLAMKPKYTVGVVLIVPIVIGVFSRTAGEQTWLGAHRKPDEGNIRLYVYEKLSCPACQRFKETVVPTLAKEFGDTIEIMYLDFSRLPMSIDFIPAVVAAYSDRVILIKNPFENLTSQLQQQQTKRIPEAGCVGTVAPASQ